MNARRLIASLTLALGLVVAPAARAAHDAFLKLPGIEGDSRDAQHPGWIEVDSWQFEQIRAAAGASPSARSSRIDFRDISIQKKLDKASPKLAEAYATGKHFPEATIVLRKAGGGQQDYLVVKLEEVVISSVRTSGHGTSEPTETLSLNFGKIKWEYTAQRTPTPALRAAQVAPGALKVAVAPKITGASAAAPFMGTGVTLTVTSTGPCLNAFVDYGDGSISEGHELTTTSTQLTHTYATAGAKTIKVGGYDAPYWSSNPKLKTANRGPKDCAGWAPEVNVTLRSATAPAPAVRR